MRHLAAVALLAGLLTPASAAPAQAAACDRTAMPYAGIPGAHLEPTDYVSRDRRPVRYTRWRGFVPGFDGMPFSVDVTVPCGTRGRQPTVVMAHGFTDDKTIWEETDRSQPRRLRVPAPPPTATGTTSGSRRAATSPSTTRRAGWHDSCGPDADGRASSGSAPARSACPMSTGSISTTSVGRSATRSGWPAGWCRAGSPIRAGWRSPAAPTAAAPPRWARCSEAG